MSRELLLFHMMIKQEIMWFSLASEIPEVV